MGAQGWQDAAPPARGAEPPAGPHGGLHGAAAWDWHRREGRMDARHVCPWCAPDGGCPHPGRRGRGRLDELIARIDEMIARIREERAAIGRAQGHDWPWIWSPDEHERLNPYKEPPPARALLAKDAPSHRTTCPECNGAGYVEASAKDEGKPDDLGQNRFFSGGYIRVMRLR